MHNFHTHDLGWVEVGSVFWMVEEDKLVSSRRIVKQTDRQSLLFCKYVKYVVKTT